MYFKLAIYIFVLICAQNTLKFNVVGIKVWRKYWYFNRKICRAAVQWLRDLPTKQKVLSSISVEDTYHWVDTSKVRHLTYDGSILGMWYLNTAQFQRTNDTSAGHMWCLESHMRHQIVGLEDSTYRFQNYTCRLPLAGFAGSSYQTPKIGLTELL
jgi:hypothetical protein